MKNPLMLLCLLWSSICFADIEVPSTNEPHQPILAEVASELPEGAEVKISWGIESATGTTATLIPVDGDSVAHIWAAPGRHRVTASVTWIVFEEVEIASADGTKRIIKNLLQWDNQYYSKIFSVKSGPDPPKPDPDIPDPPKPDPDVPPTPGPRWILMIHDVDDTTPKREDLWADIWEYNQNNQKHSMVQLDDTTVNPDGSQPEWLGKYLAVIKEKNVSLPAMVILTTTEPAKVLYVGSAPQSLEEYQTTVKKYGG